MSSVMEIAMKEMGDLIALAATPKNAVDALKAETVTGAYNAKGYGLIGNGTTNDYAALSALLTTIGSAKATIIFSPGTYKISSNITIPSNVALWFLTGAMLSPDSGVTITINGQVDAGIYQIFTGSGTISGSIKVPKIYPEWFGAVADGVANDALAIQNAINTGNHVHLSKGNYFIGNTGLTGVKGLSGEGKSFSKITYNGSATTAISVVNENWVIRDINIEHTGTPSSGSGISITSGSYGSLESVFIRNGVNGVAIASSQSVKIRDIEVWGFIGYGLAFLGSNNDIFVSDCFINGQLISGAAGNGTGIRLVDKAEAITFDSVEVILCSYSMSTDATSNTNGNRPAYCRFTNCFFDSSSDGVLIDKVVNFYFNQCWFSNRPSTGCIVNSGDDIVFSECSFINNYQHGCLVQSAAKRVKFKECSFISNNVQNNGSNGLVIAAGTTDFIVQGCTATNGQGFSGIQSYGISVSPGASDRYIIADNLINGNQTGGVSDGGSGTNKRVANNY